MSLEHIKPSRRHMADFEAEKRISIVQEDIWIEYPSAKKILNIIDNMLKFDARTQEQAPCLLVYGAGGSGKSSIINKLKKQHKNTSCNLAFMSFNDNPNNLMVKHILRSALDVPLECRPNSQVLIPRDIQSVIKLRSIKGVVIDEFHDSLLVNRLEQRKNMAFLKGLSGPPTYLSIFGFGTQDSVNALGSDIQLKRRFHFEEIEPWTETEMFRSFLAAYEQNLPLKKPSGLYGPELVKLILQYTDGVTDSVVKIIKAAAKHSIVTGQESITPSMLHLAASQPWSY